MMYSREVLSAVLVCLVGIALSAPKPTQPWDHTISTGIRFYYDSILNHFVAITSGTCFLAPLSHDEQDHLHTATGVEDLEIKMMRQWVGTLKEVRIYHDDPNLPVNTTKTWCRDKDIFLLQRDVNSLNPPSPFGTTKP